MSFIIDFIIISLVILGVYWGRKSQFLIELSKLFGIFLATFVSVHYYIRFSQYLKDNNFFSSSYHDMLSFFVLAGIIIILFIFITEGWLIILDFKLPELLDRWGGCIICTLRYILIASLIVLGCLLSPWDELRSLVDQSFGGKYFKKISVSIYRNVFYGFVHNFLPDEQFNDMVSEVVSNKVLKK